MISRYLLWLSIQCIQIQHCKPLHPTHPSTCGLTIYEDSSGLQAWYISTYPGRSLHGVLQPWVYDVLLWGSLQSIRHPLNFPTYWHRLQNDSDPATHQQQHTYGNSLLEFSGRYDGDRLPLSSPKFPLKGLLDTLCEGTRYTPTQSH